MNRLLAALLAVLSIALFLYLLFSYAQTPGSSVPVLLLLLVLFGISLLALIDIWHWGREDR